MVKSKKKIKKKELTKENRQLLWFFVVVIVFFSAFLIPYFYNESTKKFEVVGADWVIEEYDGFTAYHAKFPALSGEGINYNIWLRNDPRTNEVPTNGTFNSFKYGGIFSFDEVIGECRGDVARVVADLSGFIERGVGVGPISVATTNPEAYKQNKTYADCNTLDRTVIILKIGETFVVQSSENSFCYTINIKDCEDILGMEKFMIKTIEDFGDLENK